MAMRTGSQDTSSIMSSHAKKIGMSSFGARFNTATLTLTNSKISCLSKINNKQVNILHHK